MKNKKLVVLGIVILTLTAVIFGTVAAKPIPKVDPVLVPVIFDGVYYEADEFNKIHQELNAQGKYLEFVVGGKGDLYVFSSLQKWFDYASENKDAPPLSEEDLILQTEERAEATCSSPSYSYTRHYKEDGCTGDVLSISYLLNRGNLWTYSFGNNITSLKVTSNPSVIYYWMYDDIDYQGDNPSELLYNSGLYDHLQAQAFNNKAESIQHWIP